MNKEEVKKVLLNSKERNVRPYEGSKHSIPSEFYARDIALVYDECVELIDQLDEPEKPVVPDFVGEYIKSQQSRGCTLFEAFDDAFEFGDDRKTGRWIFHEDNEDLFGRAWLYGYEVEKEKKYCLKDREGSYLSKYEMGHHNVGGTVYWNYKPELAIKTTDKTRLEKIRKLVGGTVEEVKS